MDSQQKKILVVDDSRSGLSYTRSILQNRQYSLLTATRGDEALGILEREKPALILLDFMLPDIQGDELCRHIRAHPQLRDVSIVFLVSRNQMFEKERCLDAGCNDFLLKPLNSVELNRKVEKFISIPERIGYRLLLRVEYWDPEPKKAFGNSVNLSTNGVLLETNADLVPGSIVKIHFYFSFRGQPLGLLGRVVRIQKNGSSWPQSYGIEFHGQDDEEEEAIRLLLSQIQSHRRAISPT